MGSARGVSGARVHEAMDSYPPSIFLTPPPMAAKGGGPRFNARNTSAQKMGLPAPVFASDVALPVERSRAPADEREAYDAQLYAASNALRDEATRTDPMGEYEAMLSAPAERARGLRAKLIPIAEYEAKFAAETPAEDRMTQFMNHTDGAAATSDPHPFALPAPVFAAAPLVPIAEYRAGVAAGIYPTARGPPMTLAQLAPFMAQAQRMAAHLELDVAPHELDEAVYTLAEPGMDAVAFEGKIGRWFSRVFKGKKKGASKKARDDTDDEDESSSSLKSLADGQAGEHPYGDELTGEPLEGAISRWIGRQARSGLNKVGKKIAPTDDERADDRTKKLNREKKKLQEAKAKKAHEEEMIRLREERKKYAAPEGAPASEWLAKRRELDGPAALATSLARSLQQSDAALFHASLGRAPVADASVDLRDFAAIVHEAVASETSMRATQEALAHMAAPPAVAVSLEEAPALCNASELLAHTLARHVIPADEAVRARLYASPTLRDTMTMPAAQPSASSAARTLAARTDAALRALAPFAERMTPAVLGERVARALAADIAAQPTRVAGILSQMLHANVARVTNLADAHDRVMTLWENGVGSVGDFA